MRLRFIGAPMNVLKTTISHPFPVAVLIGFLTITLFIELFRKQSVKADTTTIKG